MEIQKPAGVKGKRNQERIDQKLVNDNFVADFPLTQFARKAIEVIYFMRVVSNSQLIDITGYEYKYATAQLLVLHLNRFIRREYPPKNNNRKGSQESYYFLDEAGKLYISGALDIPLKEVKWDVRDNLIKYEKLNHALNISAIRASLEKAAIKNEHKIIDCMADRHLQISFKHDNKEVRLRPDMYFKYQVGKNMHWFLVEVDLGTMAATGFSPNTTSFDKKVQYYEAFKQSGEYRDYFYKFPRILVVTTTTDRAKRLKEAVKARQETNIEFLFTTFSILQESPLEKIYLTTTDQFISMLDDRPRVNIQNGGAGHGSEE